VIFGFTWWWRTNDRWVLGVALGITSLSALFTLNNFDVQLTLLASYSLVTTLGFLLLVLSHRGSLIWNAVISIAAEGLINLITGVRRDYAIFVSSFDEPKLGSVTLDSTRLRAAALFAAACVWVVVPAVATAENTDVPELLVLTWLSYLLVLFSARVGVHVMYGGTQRHWGAEVVLAGTTSTWTNELTALALAVVNAYYADNVGFRAHILTAVGFVGLGLRLGYISEVGFRTRIKTLADAPIGHVVFLRPGFARNSRETGSASGGHLAARLDLAGNSEEDPGQHRQISMSMYVALKNDDEFPVDDEEAKAQLPPDRVAWYV